MKNKKKITYDQALNYTKYRLEVLERQFKEASDNFIWQMQQGGGINNIHMLDTLNSLRFLYTDIAAHRDTLRALELKF